VSLLVFGALAAAAYRAVPVYYSNSELIDACDFIASAAAKKPLETIEREVKDKARELGITEVLADKNAIRASKTSGDAGSCTITLRYKRTIDFYGTYKWTLETNKRITKPIFENIS
jgi:hypothetical protein